MSHNGKRRQDKILPSTSQIGHHHNDVTNMTMSPTSLSPIFFKSNVQVKNLLSHMEIIFHHLSNWHPLGGILNLQTWVLSENYSRKNKMQKLAKHSISKASRYLWTIFRTMKFKSCIYLNFFKPQTWLACNINI